MVFFFFFFLNIFTRILADFSSGLQYSIHAEPDVQVTTAYILTVAHTPVSAHPSYSHFKL